jgi:hypothetical protein
MGECADESGELMLAMPDETQKAVLLWNLTDKNPQQTLHTPEVALDLCPVVLNGKRFTAVLMENGLQMYACRAV